MNEADFTAKEAVPTQETPEVDATLPEVAIDCTEPQGETELQSLRKEVESLRNQLSERDNLEKANARINSELSQFFDYFPESSLDEIPDEVWDKVKKGASLSAEYSLFMRKAELERARIGKVNERNRQMSAGSVQSGEGERYYSPSEVRKMTPAQVKKHYDDIVESMRHWN